jgi:hypothetical protein
MNIFYDSVEQWFKHNVSNGNDFLINSEYYGYSIRMNGNTYKYNHNLKQIK